MNTPMPQLSPRLAALREKIQATRGRLLFAADMTASREPLRDLAATLTAGMLEEAAKVGGLSMQLAHYGGDEFHCSSWLSDPAELISRMRTIRCMSGATQIARTLKHVWIENQRKKIDACVFIGDAVEEVTRAISIPPPQA